MQQPQHLTSDNKSMRQLHKMILLDDKHWRHIQRRYYISPRELQIAKLICHGFNNEEIASDLNIKHGTVKTHIRNIYRRIRVKNKIELLLTFLHEAARFSTEAGAKPPILQMLEVANQNKKTKTKHLRIPQKE